MDRIISGATLVAALPPPCRRRRHNSHHHLHRPAATTATITSGATHTHNIGFIDSMEAGVLLT